MSLTKCNIAYLSTDYNFIIQDLGKKWYNDLKNPVNTKVYIDFVVKWDLCIKNWASDPTIPLLIRKREGRELGTVITHSTGRKLILVDNSPAQWIFSCTCNGSSPPTDIISDLENGVIPIAMVLPKLKPGVDTYRGKLSNCPNTQTLGWYLGHKAGVGLYKKISNCTIDELQNHFIKLMSPSNMFVVPKDMRGLAELIDFVKQQ
jgi:hypothetical protein